MPLGSFPKSSRMKSTNFKLQTSNSKLQTPTVRPLSRPLPGATSESFTDNAFLIIHPPPNVTSAKSFGLSDKTQDTSPRSANVSPLPPLSQTSKMPSSSPASRSVSPEVAETMQIFVKSVSGDRKLPCSPLLKPPTHTRPAIPITVPQNLSIRNLTTLLSIRTSLPPSDLRLVYAGKHLSSGTLEDYHIQREATLHLAGRVRGGMPPKKIKCSYKDCKDGAQRIIGDCGFCQGHYCGKHRLLEDHKCDGLEDVSSSPPSVPWCFVLSDAEYALAEESMADVTLVGVV